MTCSPARLAANKLNAQLSTGPKSEEGKNKSRANAIKHGLCSTVLQAEDADLVHGRISEWFFSLKPQNDYHSWLVDKIAVWSLRIDRGERMERRLRDRRSLRAELAWDDDRRFEVEVLGRKIASRPAEIVEALRQSPVGCDWLISRWSMLAHAADNKAWTTDQIALAFNLLGTPHEFREGQLPGDILDIDGLVSESNDKQSAVARREIAILIERRAIVADLDEVDRELTRVDLFDESNPELKKLRRYEGTLHNRLRWALSELKYVSPHFKPCPELMLKMVTNHKEQPLRDDPEPAPPPATARAQAKAKIDPNAPWDIDCPHPPFEIEPHEVPADGSKANLFKVLLTRQEKREKKAEANREARRRKAEKLRA